MPLTLHLKTPTLVNFTVICGVRNPGKKSQQSLFIFLQLTIEKLDIKGRDEHDIPFRRHWIMIHSQITALSGGGAAKKDGHEK